MRSDHAVRAAVSRQMRTVSARSRVSAAKRSRMPASSSETRASSRPSRGRTVMPFSSSRRSSRAKRPKPAQSVVIVGTPTARLSSGV
jgi:hypothetical protein